MEPLTLRQATWDDQEAMARIWLAGIDFTPQPTRGNGTADLTP